jgi:hypothetical protein
VRDLARRFEVDPHRYVGSLGVGCTVGMTNGDGAHFGQQDDTRRHRQLAGGGVSGKPAR